MTKDEVGRSNVVDNEQSGHLGEIAWEESLPEFEKMITAVSKQE